MNQLFPYLKTQYLEVLNQVEMSCLKAGRTGDEVTLMAVSKTQPLEKILALYELGHRIFGENRVLEAQSKCGGLPSDCELHMIGHLQSNKAKTAVHIFKSLQSLDSLSTAQALDKALGQISRTLNVLLEFNTSEEASKDGVRSWDELASLTDKIRDLEHLQIQGLMTMAPYTQDPSLIRPCFRKLFEIREKLKIHTGLSLPILSMGMSNDFTLAIEEGSTLVRVGTSIFGERL